MSIAGPAEGGNKDIKISLYRTPITFSYGFAFSRALRAPRFEFRRAPGVERLSLRAETRSGRAEARSVARRKGARDAGSTRDPRARPPRGDQAGRYLSIRHRPEAVIRKSAISPASRTRCLRLAPKPPRWPDLSGALPFGPTPNHRCGLRRCGNGRHRSDRNVAKNPVTRDRRAGSLWLGPPGLGCTSLHPGPGHRP